MPTRLSGRSFWKGHISLGEWSSPDHNPWAWGAGTQRPEALGGWGLGKEQMPRERERGPGRPGRQRGAGVGRGQPRGESAGTPAQPPRPGWAVGGRP